MTEPTRTLPMSKQQVRQELNALLRSVNSADMPVLGNASMVHHTVVGKYFSLNLFFLAQARRGRNCLHVRVYPSHGDEPAPSRRHTIRWNVPKDEVVGASEKEWLHALGMKVAAQVPGNEKVARFKYDGDLMNAEFRDFTATEWLRLTYRMLI